MSTPATYSPDLLDSYLRIVFQYRPEGGFFGEDDRQAMVRLLEMVHSVGVVPPKPAAVGAVYPSSVPELTEEYAKVIAEPKGAASGDYWHKLYAERTAEADGLRRRCEALERAITSPQVSEPKPAAEVHLSVCGPMDEPTKAALAEMIAVASRDLQPAAVDPDLGPIGNGHVCKHGIRWPHGCQQCADAAWEREKAKPAAVGDGELLPCPHCSGEAERSVGRKGDGSPFNYIECIKCGAMSEPEIWNTHATPSPSGPSQDIIDRIREVARAHGWAIGVHGSLRRDIDLIAVPWTKESASSDVLKVAICSAIGYRELDRTTTRPHGRRTALLVEQNATHEQEAFNRGEFTGPPDPKGQWIPPAVDLSFVDPREAQAKAEGPAQAVEVTAAARDVLTERQRQDTAEGYHAQHDDDHEDGEMANAAAYYAMTDGTREYLLREHITERSIMPRGWKFKPKDRRRDLVRAGALILAEIERLDRGAVAAPGSDGEKP